MSVERSKYEDDVICDKILSKSMTLGRVTFRCLQISSVSAAYQVGEQVFK